MRTSVRGCGQDIGGTKDLTTDSASDRSTLVRNTGTATELCTLCSKYTGGNILGNTDNLPPSVGWPSITRAPSPSEDHSLEIQHSGESTPRDSEETIILPNPDLAEMVSGCYLGTLDWTG